MEKYQEIMFLGKGTFGTVMKCFNRTTKRLVAIKKMINKTDSHFNNEMIVREITLLKMLKNNHIVEMIEVFRYAGCIYIVFPYMTHNLYEYMKLKNGNLTLIETKKFSYQVLLGLNYIHSRNILHRDVKPENILFSQSGIIKLCDFGISRLYTPNDLLDLSTKVGTIWYQAPEVLMGLKKYNSMIDIWSVGILMTELLENLPLVMEDTCIAQLYSIVKILHCNETIHSYLNRKGYKINLLPSPSKSYELAITAMPLREKYPKWPVSVLKMVTYCLQLEPNNRKTAAELLDTEFFTAGRFLSKFNQELAVKLDREKIEF